MHTGWKSRGRVFQKFSGLQCFEKVLSWFPTFGFITFLLTSFLEKSGEESCFIPPTPTLPPPMCIYVLKRTAALKDIWLNLNSRRTPLNILQTYFHCISNREKLSNTWNNILFIFVLFKNVRKISNDSTENILTVLKNDFCLSIEFLKRINNCTKTIHFWLVPTNTFYPFSPRNHFRIHFGRQFPFGNFSTISLMRVTL